MNRRLAVRALYLAGSACWALFALGLGLFLIAYLTDGAGLPFFGLRFSSGSVLLGVGHFIGFTTGVLVCLTVSAALFARGVER